ncbi:Uncharacterised protein [Mycobacterium tuberculosis]|nr:Uncharacterised protein [Mycobacterium tuberculosis]
MTSERPWPAQRSSTSLMNMSVSASDLVRSAAIAPWSPLNDSAASTVSSPHSSPASAMIGCVPHR